MTSDVAQLYHGPLEEFVARRSTMARELRSTDREAAANVAGLRKPSVAAWAIDQVAAADQRLVAELLAAGADARDAQQSAAGAAVGAETLREAFARMARAVEAVTAAAETVLAHSGHPAGDEAMRRIRMTLQAAATAGAATRVALWRGTLDRDVEPAGFGAVEAGDPDPPDLTAALVALRQQRHKPAAARDRATSPRPELARDRTAKRRTSELSAAARRARAVATTKRDHADRLAASARLAEEEAQAASRAADSAEEAARAAEGR